MNRKRLRPGVGWSHIGGPVYEHDSGVRIHVSGICSFGVPHFINGRAWPESMELDRFVAINGGNRRRGVMAWALEKLRTHQ